MIGYRNLDECESFAEISRLPKPALSLSLSPERIEEFSIWMPEGLVYNFAASPVDEKTLKILQKLADEQQLIEKYKALSTGARMNTGENRMVLHHLARGMLQKAVVDHGNDIGAFYATELRRIAEFARSVHSGVLRSGSGQKFDTVVQIGIGGSDLGPRAACIALERWAGASSCNYMKTGFISNVDPDDADSVLRNVNLATTLFVLVSKSGTTQETLANETLVRSRLEAAGLDPAKSLIAVTSASSPLARNPDYLSSFYIDDFIGGRYSTSSAVGGVIMSLAYGPETFSDFLAGAHSIDEASMETSIRKNATLMDALIGIYERSILGLPATAVLPYSEALSRFPAHLQQLDMESNGKSVNRNGEPVHYATGPVVFGEPGTNGQHSFYQLLHQGTDIVPLQFIGFLENQRSEDVISMGTTSRQKLLANLMAQIVAFSRGKEDPNPNKRFSGGRPSTLLLGQKLGPRQLGALFAHYENKVMFQGFAWNLNSFDQEGVQLGKVLAGKVLSILQGEKTDDDVLKAYARLAGNDL